MEPTTFHSRRRFLAAGAGAACVAAFGAAAWRWRGAQESGLQTFNRTSWALGTDVTLTVLHRDEATARAALDAAFVELNGVEDVLSLYRPQSQLVRLNREGKLEYPHEHFLNVMKACITMSERTGGAFDATVQPLWELYFEAKKNGGLPSDGEIEAARAKVDWRKVKVSSDRVEFDDAGMKLTFNGVAQGYAADRVLAVLKSRGIEHALIDTGELEPIGKKADGSAYKCGIQHPRNAESFAGVCKLDGRALATSGDYATKFSDDFVYNHIFNPKTGRSPLEFSSVSILAPTGMLADALSTAVFVLGREKGMELIRSCDRCDAFVIGKDEKTFATGGFGLEC